jgi:hypothetical protein
MWVLHGFDARTTFTIVTLSFAAAVKLIEEFRRSADGPMTFVIDQFNEARGKRPDDHADRPDMDSSER